VIAFTKLAHDPDSTLDYTVDWSQWLLRDGDTIASATWTVPTGITQESADNDGTTAVVWLSAGTVGESYQITSHIVTAGGRSEDHSFIIVCEEK
jgi:hypothetical protein